MLYSLIKSLLKPFLKILFGIKVRGKENIPKEVGCIVCSNHYHWLDPVIVACFTNRQVHFMAKKELFNNKVMSTILKNVGTFPVNRETADITAVKNAIKVVKNNKVLGIFPEGTRVKAGDNITAEPGIAMIGIKGKAQILPIGIAGNYKIGGHILINIGQPISLEEHYGKRKSIEEFEVISENIMKEVRKLIQNY